MEEGDLFAAPTVLQLPGIQRAVQRGLHPRSSYLAEVDRDIAMHTLIALEPSVVLRCPGSVIAELAERHQPWAQLLATCLETEIATIRGGEAGGALGAARLGWLAAGGAEADVCIAPAIERSFLPDPAQGGRLSSRYERFRALYPRVKDLFVRGEV